MLSLTRLITAPLLAGLLLLGQLTAAQADTAILQHDDVGNITQRTTPLGTTTYTYDALNRLQTESGPAKTQTQTFSYDPDGNRLSDGAGSYTYSPSANRMATRLGAAVTIDPAGHVTADGSGRSFVYNQAGQLFQVKQGGVLFASYYYNFQGQRTRKVTTASAPQGAQTILYQYDPQGHLLAELSGSGAPLRTFVWRDDTPIAQIEYAPTRKVLYYEVDHLNTPRAAMDETGKVVWRWESDAFGATLANEDADGDGVKVTVNLRFPGQYYDKESGLHYNYFRDYDPATGRYVESDPIGLDGGINLYTYVGGNPVSLIDPLGLAPDSPGGGGNGGSKGGSKQCDGCKEIKKKCIEQCSDSSLPSGNNGFRFWNCLNKCMADNGCGSNSPTPAPNPDPKPAPKVPPPPWWAPLLIPLLIPILSQ